MNLMLAQNLYITYLQKRARAIISLALKDSSLKRLKMRTVTPGIILSFYFSGQKLFVPLERRWFLWNGRMSNSISNLSHSLVSTRNRTEQRTKRHFRRRSVTTSVILLFSLKALVAVMLRDN